MTVIKIVLIEKTFTVTLAAVLQYKVLVIVCVRSMQGHCNGK